MTEEKQQTSEPDKLKRVDTSVTVEYSPAKVPHVVARFTTEVKSLVFTPREALELGITLMQMSTRCGDMRTMLQRQKTDGTKRPNLIGKN